jgi:hypothetical protein
MGGWAVDDDYNSLIHESSQQQPTLKREVEFCKGEGGGYFPHPSCGQIRLDQQGKIHDTRGFHTMDVVPPGKL